ncbi:MAG: hypothetical protein KBD28_05840 [Chitinophagaceae bacterium]|nr:hypothetical protein [Chitinophagaceae bacterium]
MQTLQAQPFDYYSQGNLDPTDPLSWNTARDGTGNAGDLNNLIFDEGNNFYIQENHSMPTTQEWYLNGGATVIIENGGVLISEFQIVLSNGTFNVLDGGKYIQNSNDFLPWSIFNGTTANFEGNIANGGSIFEITSPNTKIENPSGGFFNLTINSGGTCQSLTDITINGLFKIEGGSTYNAANKKVNLGSTATTSGTGLLQTQVLSNAISSNKTWEFSVEYSSSSGSIQNVLPGTYNNLNTSAFLPTQRNRSYSGVIKIAGTFTPTTATNTVNTSTFEFNAIGSQNIPSFSFYNLTISNAGTKTITGDVSVNNTLSVNDAAGFLSINGNTLTLNKDISLTGSLKGSSTSNLTIAGTSGGAPTIKFNAAITDSIINTFTLNRTGSGAGITLASGVAITKLLNINNGTLFMNNQIVTLRSSSIANTAQIGQFSGAINYGSTGLFTVERFIPNTPKNNRGYRDIAPSVNTPSGINFFETWQESGNNVNGLGVFITGVIGASPGGIDNTTGLDKTLSGAKSLYTQLNGVWSEIVNSKSTKPHVYQGYRVFVRGDRNINLYQVPQATIMNRAVTLRTHGKIITGSVTYTTTGTSNSNLNSSYGLNNNNTSGDYSFLGNPYVAAIDWGLTTKTNISNTYTVWDGTIGTQGAYVSWDGMTNNNVSSNVNQYIQPGQAFFVETTANSPQLVIAESNKATSSTLTGVFKTKSTINKIAFGIYKDVADLGGETNMDGCVALFYPEASNAINRNDAPKFSNGTENISIFRNNKNISIEHREMPLFTDTIPLRVFQMQSGITYTLKVFTQDFNTNCNAYILDKFENTEFKTNSTDTTNILFTVNSSIAASFNNRFYLVFKPKIVLPLATINVSAIVKNNNIHVGWQTNHETQLLQYEIEKSKDGIRFSKIGVVKANNLIVSEYNFLDTESTAKVVYYRIKMIQQDGNFSYSNTIQVQLNFAVNNQLLVYPNPIKNKTFTLQLFNIKVAEYKLQLFNDLGQEVYFQRLIFPTTTNISQNIDLKNSNLPFGSYQLLLTNNLGYKQTERILIEH